MANAAQKYMVTCKWGSEADWSRTCYFEVFNLTDEDLVGAEIEFLADVNQTFSANQGFRVEKNTTPVKGKMIDGAAVVPAQGVMLFDMNVSANGSGKFVNLPHNFKVNGEAADLIPDTQPPSQPKNLHAVAKGSVTLTLAWDASTDDVMLSGYELELSPANTEGETTFTSMTTSIILQHLQESTEYQVKVRAFDLSQNYSAFSPALVVSTTAALPDAGAYSLMHAPFVDYTAWPTPQVSVYGAASGLKGYTLGFLAAADMNEGVGEPDYKPCWGGQTSIADANNPDAGFYNADATVSDYCKGDIAAFRAAGGDVAISFGGANSNFLEEYITDISKLAALYQGVLDNYQVNHIDFDIEGGAVPNTEMLRVLIAAMVEVQRNNPDLQISFTLPVDGQKSEGTQGLTGDGVAIVQMVHDAGLNPSMFNAMSMDFGVEYPADTTLEAVTISVEAMHQQIADIFTHWTKEMVWRRLGITPMFGVNDTGITFSLADQQAVVELARKYNVGMLSGWDATRDYNQGTEMCYLDKDQSNLFQCTYVGDESYQYSKIIATYERK